MYHIESRAPKVQQSQSKWVWSVKTQCAATICVPGLFWNLCSGGADSLAGGLNSVKYCTSCCCWHTYRFSTNVWCYHFKKSIQIQKDLLKSVMYDTKVQKDWYVCKYDDEKDWHDTTSYRRHHILAILYCIYTILTLISTSKNTS